MKHPKRECSLNQIEIYKISTHNFPSLPRLKVIYQKYEELKKLCYISHKRPWKPKLQVMIQYQSKYFNSYWTNPSIQHIYQPWIIPTQQWVAPPPNCLWKQGWINPSMQEPQQLMTQPPMQLLHPPQMQGPQQLWPLSIMTLVVQSLM